MMSPIARFVRVLTLSTLLSAGSCAAAQAQNYPDRPIKLIAPFPAGGLVDVLARAVGDELSKSLGQPVIVENRPGAGGNIGADAVAKSAPDGYTLLMTSAGILTANEFLYAKMPFDTATAFVPVSNVADMPMMVVVNPKIEAKTLAEFVAYAKANPGKLNFGSPGVGTTGHLGLALFMHAADIKLTHVPYKGAAPAITDLIAGQIDGVVDNPPTVLPHIKAGSSSRWRSPPRTRMAQLPDLPTAAQAGVANFEASSWFGVDGARRHAAGHRRASAQGHRDGAGQAGTERTLRQIRRAPDRQFARGIRQADRRRPQDVGRCDQGRRHHAELIGGAAFPSCRARAR